MSNRYNTNEYWQLPLTGWERPAQQAPFNARQELLDAIGEMRNVLKMCQEDIAKLKSERDALQAELDALQAPVMYKTGTPRVLIEQISERFEAAKRELFEAERTGKASQAQLLVLNGAYRCWGEALHLAQQKRGIFVG